MIAGNHSQVGFNLHYEMKTEENKKYRFFFHYRKSTKAMTVHFQNVCYPCQNVVCYAKTETKWNKRQPMLVMQGVTSGIDIQGDTIIINK